MGALLVAIAIVGALFVATGIARRALAEAEAEEAAAPCCCAPCSCTCHRN
ncbi:hypothetical protein [Streptomyces olivaceus]